MLNNRISKSYEGGYSFASRRLTTVGLLFTVFCLIPLMMTSCADISTSFAEDEENVDGIAISEARAIFERAVAESASLTETNPTSFFLPTLDLGNIVPDWSTAKRSKTATGDFQSVDVRISASYRYRVYQIDTEYNDTCVVNLTNKMVIVKDEVTGQSGCFLEFFIRSNEYIKNHKKDETLNYLNCGGMGDFSGLKIYTDIAGKIVRVNRYENGEAKCGVNVLTAEDATDYLRRVFIAQCLLSDIQFQKGMPVTRGGDYTLGAETDGKYVYLEIGGKRYRISLEDLANGMVVIDGDAFYGGDLDASEIIAYLKQSPDLDPVPETPDEIYRYFEEYSNKGGGGGKGDISNNPSDREGGTSKVKIGNITIEGKSELVNDLKCKLERVIKDVPLLRVLLTKISEVRITFEKKSVRGFDSPYATSDKNTIQINPEKISYITLMEELFHVYQRQSLPDNYMYTGNLEFEAKIFISVLSHDFNISDDTFSMREYIDIFYNYYRNPEDLLLREDAISSLARLGYYEQQYPTDGNLGTESNLKRLKELVEQSK